MQTEGELSGRRSGRKEMCLLASSSLGVWVCGGQRETHGAAT